jgi:hypothetical protein
MPLTNGYIHAANQIHATIYDLPMQNFHCLLALKVALCHNKYIVWNRNGKSQNTCFEDCVCYVQHRCYFLKIIACSNIPQHVHLPVHLLVFHP